MFKNLFLLLIIPFLAFMLFSCEDLEDNSPAFQVVLNGELFKANEMYAKNVGSGLEIHGIADQGELIIFLESARIGTHAIDEETASYVKFVDASNKTYTTQFENAKAEVNIDYIDLDGVIGSFYFNAHKTNRDVARGYNGHIYEVPFGTSPGGPNIPDLPGDGDGGDDSGTPGFD